MKWWEEKPEQYSKLREELNQFSFLDCDVEDGMVTIRGVWPVYGETFLIDKYSIKVVLPDDYPLTVPSVYELEGKIPRIADRHINGDGSCCIFAPPERWEQWPLGVGIDVLFNGPIKYYFFSQAYFDREQVWPLGEWLHGNEGVVQYYMVRLGVTSIPELKRLLIMINIKKQTTFWSCPCGSKKKYSICHKDKVEKLEKILPIEEWESLYKIVSNFRWLG